MQPRRRLRSGDDPSSFRRWRPATFRAWLRGEQPEPLVSRWEQLLRAERSSVHRVVAAAAGSPRWRRMLGLPAQLARPAGSRLEEREQRVLAVRGTALYQALARLGREDQKQVPQSGAVEGERPAPGPLMDREIDRALELLAGVPFEELQERGWQLHPNHFYWPLNDVPFLRENLELWTRPRVPLEIDWDLDGQDRLVERLRGYASELEDAPQRSEAPPGTFAWRNGIFDADDAYAYYGIVRELRPKRVVEVGVGWSSLVLARALEANRSETDVLLIDPTEKPAVLGTPPPGWRFLAKLVQHAELEVFESLEAGDILFYDGSHCVRTGGDVNWMLFEVLPRLAAGVWVHFHDVLWPSDYRPEWVLDEGWTWNEQYALQAFLMHNKDYRVRLAVNMTCGERGNRLGALGAPGMRGTSVWLEKIAAPG